MAFNYRTADLVVIGVLGSTTLVFLFLGKVDSIYVFLFLLIALLVSMLNDIRDLQQEVEELRGS